jgi:hypothetical protein
MRYIKRKKSIAALLALAALAIAAVGAYAYFTSTGTGAGSATVASVEDWNVSVADVSGGPLYPGSGVENKTYTVTNASAGKQLLQAVTIEIANADGSPWDGTGTCSKNDFSINDLAGGATATDTYGIDPANDYANGAGPGAVAFTVKMVDTHANQDDCKGETPPILVSAS